VEFHILVPAQRGDDINFPSLYL